MWASSPTTLNRTNIVRISYVKYSTGANETIRTAYRALGKPDSTAARRAFLAGRTIGEWHAESKCLFRRVSAISRPAPLFSPFFSGKTEKNGPPEASSAIPAHSKCTAGGIPHQLVQKRYGHRSNSEKWNIPTPSRIEICRRGFLWMRPWSGRR